MIRDKINTERANFKMIKMNTNKILVENNIKLCTVEIYKLQLRHILLGVLENMVVCKF